MFPTLKELVLAALVAIVCRFGETKEFAHGQVETTFFGPLQFTECLFEDGPSLTFHCRNKVHFLLPS
jgi:hypothetical protein